MFILPRANGTVFGILIYQDRGRSYRELPMRWAELGSVYRYERSGVLHGMLRVRGFTQDDAHIFCTADQLADEIAGVLQLVDEIFSTFGFEYTAYLATQPDEHTIGDADIWKRADADRRKSHHRRNAGLGRSTITQGQCDDREKI